jgi:hypothetical protein
MDWCSHRVGQALCYWLFTRTGQVIARTLVQKLTDIESRTPEIQQEIREFDKAITELLPLDIGKGLGIPSWFQDDSNDYDPGCDLPYDPEIFMLEQDDYPDEDTYEQYLTTQVLLPRGDSYEKGTVIRRKRDYEGNLIGRSNTNPILVTRVIEVQFPDGHIAEYSTNVLAENLISMVDDEGFETSIFKRIVDHRCDNSKALSKQEAWITS